MAAPYSSSSRTGLIAHIESTKLSFQEIVTQVTNVIGRKLTAYITSVDVRTVERWLEGDTVPHGEADPRLRFTYLLVMPIADQDKPAVVQSWLTGINPELNDRTPIRLLREQNLESVGPELLSAQRSFLAGG
jgi:hypothetical protein